MRCWRSGVCGGIAAAMLCLGAGCQSEIPIPAYASNMRRSIYPAEVPHAQAEPPPAAPRPTSADDALPRAAVLGNLIDPAPTGAPAAGGAPAGQGTSGQAAAGQPTSGQPTSGQPTSGQPTAGGPDKSAPLVRNNDVRLAQKTCPTVAKPPYPEEAKKARAEGLVTAKCAVETDGSLTCEATWSTAPTLTQPVLDQLARQKVQPFALKDGTKVRVECSYSYRYKP